MTNDNIRDRLFELAQEHNTYIQIAQDLKKERNQILLKKNKKILAKLEKKIDKLFSKLSDRYAYKKDLDVMIQGLKRNTEHIFK